MLSRRQQQVFPMPVAKAWGQRWRRPYLRGISGYLL